MISKSRNIISIFVLVNIFSSTSGNTLRQELAEPLSISQPEIPSSEALLNDVAAAQATGGLCLAETNAARAANGKGPYNYNTALENASKNHNQVMVSQNCFSHQCPGEAPFGDRITKAGYRWGGAAENIAKGYNSCNDAVNGWMKSSGHRANILGNYKDVGCVVSGPYWTCDYAKPL